MWIPESIVFLIDVIHQVFCLSKLTKSCGMENNLTLGQIFTATKMIQNYYFTLREVPAAQIKPHVPVLFRKGYPIARSCTVQIF